MQIYTFKGIHYLDAETAKKTAVEDYAKTSHKNVWGITERIIPINSNVSKLVLTFKTYTRGKRTIRIENVNNSRTKNPLLMDYYVQGKRKNERN